MSSVNGKCPACGRPLKTGFMVAGQMVKVPSCRSPICPRFGKGASS